MKRGLKTHFSQIKVKVRIGSKMISDNITKEDLRIRVHHIGGIGGFGPTDAIAKLDMPSPQKYKNENDIEWIIYDANEESLLASTAQQDSNYTLIHKCIGGANSKGRFNVMTAGSASSMLMPAPSAAQYTMFTRKDKAQIWGKHTRVVKSVDIEINTLDGLYETRKVPSADFLSVDAQGAELDIINGASIMLKSSVVGIVCEVEFAELYAGQPLFCDTQDRLRKDNFRLCQIYNHQYFNTAPYVNELQGKGFHIVGEALFFKDPGTLIDDNKLDELPTETLTQNVAQCLKLAAISVVFDQLDFALGIIRSLQEKKFISLEELADRTDIGYIKLLRDLNRSADLIEANTPPPVYESTNPDDRGNNKHEEKINMREIFSKTKLSILCVIMVISRKIAKKVMKKNMGNYYSRISKTYHAYGLNELAEEHDKRFVAYLLSSGTTFIDKLIRFIMRYMMRIIYNDDSPNNNFLGWR